MRLAPRAAVVVHRADGTIIIRSALALDSCPHSWNIRLADWASRTPHQPFLTEADGRGGRRVISYAETVHAVRAIGQGLLDLGLDAERPLAILSENSIDCALITLASLWVGVPAAPISPGYALKASEFSKLAGVLAALGHGAVYVADGARYGPAVTGTIAADMPLIVSTAPSPDRSSISLEALRRTAPGADEALANAAVTGATVAKILFTSGTGGAPKPVILPHAMLAINRQQNAQVYPFLFDEPPVLVDWLPWHHTFGGNNNFGHALWNGGTLHIDDGAPTADGIARSVALLEAYPPTLYLNTPGGIAALLPHLQAAPNFAARFFSRLKLIQYGGALLPAHHWEALDTAAIAATGTRIMIVSGLGSTECGPTPVQSSWEQQRKPEAGLPVPGVEARLVPAFGSYELRLRGPCVAPGYWRRPDLTAAAFDEEGFFKLGDAVQPIDPDDFGRGLMFDGRMSDNFKLSSGTWVMAATLRARFVAAFAPLLRDAVVTGHDRDTLGALAFADMAAARELTGCTDEDDAAVLAHPLLRQWIVGRLAALATEARGSSERIERLFLSADLPSFDNGELTDKVVASARSVLVRRAALVERLYAPAPDDAVIAL